MSTNLQKFCNFCHACGIEGPHDHSLRDFSQMGNPICCHVLLNTKCQECHELGHTKTYCMNGKKDLPSASTSPSYQSQVEPSTEPLIINMKHVKRGRPNGWIYNGKRNILKAPRQYHSTHISSLAGAFGALDVEDVSDGCDHEENSSSPQSPGTHLQETLDNIQPSSDVKSSSSPSYHFSQSDPPQERSWSSIVRTNSRPKPPPIPKSIIKPKQTYVPTPVAVKDAAIQALRVKLGHHGDRRPTKLDGAFWADSDSDSD